MAANERLADRRQAGRNVSDIADRFAPVFENLKPPMRDNTLLLSALRLFKF